MNATLTLYRDTKIIPSRNFVVESIEDYLATISNKLVKTDFQFQRLNLEGEIKFDLSQSYQEFKQDYNYNYLSIKNGTTGVVAYYFIVGKRQVADETMAFKVVMDTANTFKWNVDFTPTSRTKVVREHKDRLQLDLTAIYRIKSIGLSIETNTMPQNTEVNAFMSLTDGYTRKDINFKFYWYYAPIPSMREFRFYGFSLADLQWIIANARGYGLYYIENDNDDTQCLSFLEEISLTSIFMSIQVIRLIDYYSEGINPVLYKAELGQLIHKENSTWNLVYRNDENVQDGISCFCIPSDIVKVNVNSSLVWNINDFEDGKYYNFAPFYINGKWSQTIGWITDSSGKKQKFEYIGNWTGLFEKLDTIVIHRSGAHLYIQKAVFTGGSSGGTRFRYTSREVSGQREITSVEFQKPYYYYKGDSIPPAPSGGTTENYPDKNGQVSATETAYDLTTLSEIDRVDPKLIKIISIPYFPTEYEYDDDQNTITFGSQWVHETSVYNSLQLFDLDVKFISKIETQVNSPLNVFKRNIAIPESSALRNDDDESKIYHSDFYQPKFVYDSFGFVFELEKIDTEKFLEVATDKFSFEFIMTSTINSKFMFKFPEYILKMSTQDFDNILTIARNNEAPIYNSSYITYLRTAYRYDLKELEQKKFLTTFKTYTGLATRSFGILGDISKKDPNYYGASSSGLSMINNVVDSIATLNQNEWNMEEKLEQLKNQANSVSGSDDLDLLDAYCNNRAKLCTYKVSDRMKQLLLDLFYYFGYTTNELKIPNLQSRLWFNYVACELEVSNTGKNISEELMNNLIQRYNQGITILHKVNGEWDFAQVKENWEVDLL